MGQLITYDFNGMQDYFIECGYGKGVSNTLEFRFCTYKNKIFINPEGDFLLEMRESIRKIPLTLESKANAKAFIYTYAISYI